MGKPMLVHSPIPGQEEYNADFLLENGAALKAVDVDALLWRVRRFLNEPDLRDRLARNAAALGKPHAARDILATVLNARQPGKYILSRSRPPDGFGFTKANRRFLRGTGDLW